MIARAHVVALGGNALLCYKLLPQESEGQINRHQVYNMVSIVGDVVEIEPQPTPMMEETDLMPPRRVCQHPLLDIQAQIPIRFELQMQEENTA